MSLVGCILLALSVVNASPAHSDADEIPLVHVPSTNIARGPYNNQLEKRDGAIVVVRIQGVYATTIYTNDGSVEYDIVVDTGSSYTWVGADPKNPADEYIDSIILETTTSSDALVIDNQSIGAATLVPDLPRMLDGVLGLGRHEDSSLRGPDGNKIPTVLDNLYRQGSIRYAVFGVYFIPLNDRGVGEITFGYCNEAVITSGLTYVPITNVPPESDYWGIDASFMYGSRTIVNPTSGIVDTGSNAISIPTDAVLAYQSAIGATVTSQGWLTVSLDQYDNLQILSIIIGGQSYDLSPNAQIHPRASLASPIMLVVVESTDGKESFILGHPFVQRYYVTFNLTSSQIGFASTHNTESITN
ncbi:hypothetical protein ID866_8963 [Astraeus odoratus]|nr:hypothetical protein ID866_8963 [Astraeus odoratus]